MIAPLSAARSRADVLTSVRAKREAMLRAAKRARAEGNVPTEEHYLAAVEHLTWWIEGLAPTP